MSRGRRPRREQVPILALSVGKRINQISDDVHTIQQRHLTGAVLSLSIPERQMRILNIQDHLVNMQRGNL